MLLGGSIQLLSVIKYELNSPSVYQKWKKGMEARVPFVESNTKSWTRATIEVRNCKNRLWNFAWKTLASDLKPQLTFKCFNSILAEFIADRISSRNIGENSLHSTFTGWTLRNGNAPQKIWALSSSDIPDSTFYDTSYQLASALVHHTKRKLLHLYRMLISLFVLSITLIGASTQRKLFPVKS